MPLEYCDATVFPAYCQSLSRRDQHQLLPMSANFRSSKMTKPCLALRCCSFSIRDPSKSSSISICVLSDRDYQDAYTTCKEKGYCLDETDVRAHSVDDIQKIR